MREPCLSTTTTEYHFRTFTLPPAALTPLARARRGPPPPPDPPPAALTPLARARRVRPPPTDAHAPSRPSPRTSSPERKQPSAARTGPPSRPATSRNAQTTVLTGRRLSRSFRLIPRRATPRTPRPAPWIPPRSVHRTDRATNRSRYRRRRGQLRASPRRGRPRPRTRSTRPSTGRHRGVATTRTTWPTRWCR